MSHAESRQEPQRFGQRLLGCLHARLHADEIGDGFLELLIDRNNEIDRALRTPIDRFNKGVELRPLRLDLAIRSEVVRERGLVFEGILLRLRLEKEIEGLYTAISATTSTMVSNFFVFPGTTRRPR